jgi:membrane protease YdiL (CAAX protease family)
LASLLPITLLASLSALGEEFGWRGTLLPLLRPLGEQRAALLSGLVWGVWHLPLVLCGLTYPGQPLWLAAPAFVASAVLISLWMAGLAGYGADSVLLAALTHGALNALSEIAAPLHFPGANPILLNPFGPLAALGLWGLTRLLVAAGVFKRA